MPVTDTLYIAEIPFESGEVQFRYSRYLSDDGSRWIRHGLFCAYGKDGTLRSEGNYDHGVESGTWSDYHDNGQVAARGEYVQGKQHGHWRFWDPQGTEELSTEFNDGEEIA
jgi:antitoxin component YwqK of YwqJK toxin-antitoxin module